MTVNELIVELDKLPADAEVVLNVHGTETTLFSVELADTGEVLLLED